MIPTESALGDRARLLQLDEPLGGLSFGAQGRAEVGEQRGTQRMTCADGALRHGDRTLVELDRLVVPRGLRCDVTEIAECGGDGLVVWTEQLLADLEHAATALLRFLVVTLREVKRCDRLIEQRL